MTEVTLKPSGPDGPDLPPLIVNEADQPWEDAFFGQRWGGSFRELSPGMRARGGRLGISLTRCPPGRATTPFHAHLREDEAFYVLSGRGVFRYGDTVHRIGPGDCISCPAGSGVAHQIANPYDEDLVYLAMGQHDPHEVCTYPDSGKVLIRGLRQIGQLDTQPYMHGEPEVPRVFAMAVRPR